MTNERDAAIEAALEAFDDTYEAEYLSTGATDNKAAAIRAAILAYDQHRGKQEPVGYAPFHYVWRNMASGQITREVELRDEWLSMGVRVEAEKQFHPQPADVMALREALESVDADIRHHVRSDDIPSAALIRREAMLKVRAALSSSGGAGQ
jgi:hypothetical protein